MASYNPNREGEIMRLKIFREWLEDGFVLLPVGQFLPDFAFRNGEFSSIYSPLPEISAVEEILARNNLHLADSQMLKKFSHLHPREYELNRLYGVSNHYHSFAWLDPWGNERVPSHKYPLNLREEKDKLWRHESHRFLVEPRGYSGEVCLVAFRLGHPEHRNFRTLLVREGKLPLFREEENDVDDNGADDQRRTGCATGNTAVPAGH